MNGKHHRRSISIYNAFLLLIMALVVLYPYDICQKDDGGHIE